jgi:dTDP-glucose 4,6-dehydratase
VNLLITGGAGCIGCALIRWLLSEEAQAEREALKLRSVVNLDALTYAGNPANLDSVRGHPLYRFTKGDMTAGALVERVFREYSMKDVIHLAAESQVDRSIDNPSQFLKTNGEGTYRLFDTARRLWPHGTGKCFLHVSSDEVFGGPGARRPALFQNDPLCAEQSLGRFQGDRRPRGARLFPDVWPAGADVEGLK